jgi:hypothetical protein
MPACFSVYPLDTIKKAFCILIWTRSETEMFRFDSSQRGQNTKSQQIFSLESYHGETITHFSKKESGPSKDPSGIARFSRLKKVHGAMLEMLSATAPSDET